MPISITYIAVLALGFLGVENAQEVVDASLVVFFALAGLYGRYRLGDISILGWRKKV